MLVHEPDLFWVPNGGTNFRHVVMQELSNCYDNPVDGNEYSGTLCIKILGSSLVPPFGTDGPILGPWLTDYVAQSWLVWNQYGFPSSVLILLGMFRQEKQKNIHSITSEIMHQQTLTILVLHCVVFRALCLQIISIFLCFSNNKKENKVNWGIPSRIR